MTAPNVQPDIFWFLGKPEFVDEWFDNFIAGVEEHPVRAFDIVMPIYTSNLKKVVVLRDPYNLFASRMKHYKLEDKGTQFITYNYIDYCKRYLAGDPSITFVIYNRFVDEINYRKEILTELGLPFDLKIDITSMNKVNEVWASSFDGAELQGEASKMKVNERWTAYKDNEFYKSLFTDEIKVLSKEIFNFCPDI